MKSYKAFLTFFFIVLAGTIAAQNYKNYAIQYEKRVNLANLFPQWKLYDKNEKFHKDYFVLTTNSSFASYIHQDNGKNEKWNYLNSYMSFSNNFIEIKKQTIVSQKEIGEKTFLMEDTLVQFQWKIINEERIIEGYKCYKAYTKYDSIEIVAYFCPTFEASIGPESIGGLPGTILGMVIPQLHTTWLAQSITKLELNPPQKNQLPKKAQSINRQSLKKIIEEAYKEYKNKLAIVYSAIL